VKQKRKYKSPKIEKYILSLLLDCTHPETLIADHEEMYYEMVEKRNILFAKFWLWFQILFAVPSFIKNLIVWSFIMFANYFKIALRNIKRQKFYSFINISGLAAGLVCCILILLWVKDEIGFDKFHKNRSELYIVGTHTNHGGVTRTNTGTPPALGPAIKTDFPEIVNTTRFVNGSANCIISYEKKRFIERFRAADPAVLEMFTFPLVMGDPKTALDEPHSIIMTERMSKKYFEYENPIGKVISLDNNYDFKVTGILQNIPPNSSLHFDFLVPIEFFTEYWGLELAIWHNFAYTTYAQLEKNVSLKEINDKIKNNIKEKDNRANSEVFISRFDKLYLYGLGLGGGRIGQVRLFSLIAFFVLIIACINFMNITTARSSNREKEIGMRKVTGAHKKDIIKQFFGESVLFALISFFFSLLIVYLLLPVFNNLSGKHLSLDFSSDPTFIFQLIGIAFLTGLIGGSYPALFLSSFQPVKSLKKTIASGVKGASFRRTLVVFQFVVSIFLIIGTTIISKQLNFIKDKDLGFNKENLVYIRLNSTLKQNCEMAKQELLQNSNIQNVSLISFSPTGVYSNDDGYNWQGKNPNLNPAVSRFCTDHDFLNTFGINISEGDYYSNETIKGPSDLAGQIIINEEFARIIGKENLVGSVLYQESRPFRIIGIVKDFNFMPLYQEIGPLALFHQTENSQKDFSRYRYMFIKISSENVSQAINHIKNVYEKFSPNYPFAYQYLSEDYNRLYRSEQQMGKIIQYFTFFAVFISCLGLFGLTSFTAEQRTKEIGIRKVMGASSVRIVWILSKDFVKWVIVANIFAWPIAWMVSKSWLQNFAYKTNIGPEIFILSGFLALLIAILTVSYQSIKASRMDPAKTLKYE